jgi:hypothetical protein
MVNERWENGIREVSMVCVQKDSLWSKADGVRKCGDGSSSGRGGVVRGVVEKWVKRSRLENTRALAWETCKRGYGPDRESLNKGLVRRRREGRV